MDIPPRLKPCQKFRNSPADPSTIPPHPLNTDSVENSTSAGREGPLDGDITLVDGSNNSQDDAYNAEELTKPNKYPKRTVHDQIKKRLGKKVPLFIKP